jgi:hypothetical protein
MKMLNRKNVAISLFIATSAMMSVNVNAQQVSLEQLLSHKVQVQGQQAIKKLSLQVKQSIQSSLNAFSIEGRHQWVREVNNKEALTMNKKEIRNFTSKSSAE